MAVTEFVAIDYLDLKDSFGQLEEGEVKGRPLPSDTHQHTNLRSGPYSHRFDREVTSLRCGLVRRKLHSDILEVYANSARGLTLASWWSDGGTRDELGSYGTVARTVREVVPSQVPQCRICSWLAVKLAYNAVIDYVRLEFQLPGSH